VNPTRYKKCGEALVATCFSVESIASRDTAIKRLNQLEWEIVIREVNIANNLVLLAGARYDGGAVAGWAERRRCRTRGRRRRRGQGWYRQYEGLIAAGERV